MSVHSERAAAWIYAGVWRAIVAWLRVPSEPPSLPTHGTEGLRKVHPALGYLRYLKLKFWVALAAVDGLIVLTWLAVLAKSPAAAAVLAVPALIVAVLPDIVVYVALHLRYDTTWYVISDRSLRIRTGIWVLREITITFENVQNISVAQGPLMRLFGIKHVVVETAGSAKRGAERLERAANEAVLEGLEDADEIRELILERVGRSRSAGLGDERHDEAGAREARAPRSDARAAARGWEPEHVALLRDIRDELAALVK